MKNNQNIAIGALGLCVAILFFLQFKGSGSGPTVKLNPSSKDIAQGASTRIAFVNTDSFFKGYKKYQAFEKEIESTQKSAETNAQAKMKAIEADYMKLMQAAQSGQIQQAQAQAKEQELVARKNALEKEAQETMKIIGEKSKKETVELYATMNKYFTENKAKFNVDVVFGYQTNGNLLYFDPALDITKEVVKDLND